MDDFKDLNENMNEETVEAAEPIQQVSPVTDIPDDTRIPESAVYTVPQTEAEPAQPKGKSHAPIILLLILIFVMVSALAVYCIYTDIQMGSIGFNENRKAPDDGFSIELQENPGSKKNIKRKDDDGRYTMEGLAEYVRPQIVEIYAYSSNAPEKAISSGSGIIISEDGYIITNTHIIDGAAYDMTDSSSKPDTIKVITHDEKQYDAEITGRDRKTDIAVVKIKATGLPCAQFGNSDETVIGEQVAAVGNPEGFNGSVTDGIVSGLNRKIQTDSTTYVMDCIQTNAAISPGNSGGALVNMYGQVIGITSSKYVTSTSEGLGFAITINEAKPIIEEIISKGYVSGRIKVGITFYSMDNREALAEFKEKYKRELPEKLRGLWITNISEDCDISKTDLKIGDFILSVDGKRIQNYDDLNELLKNKKSGDTLKAECARIDKDMTISYFDIEFKLMEDKSGDF